MADWPQSSACSGIWPSNLRNMTSARKATPKISCTGGSSEPPFFLPYGRFRALVQVPSKRCRILSAFPIRARRQLPVVHVERLPYSCGLAVSAGPVVKELVPSFGGILPCALPMACVHVGALDNNSAQWRERGRRRNESQRRRGVSRIWLAWGSYR